VLDLDLLNLHKGPGEINLKLKEDTAVEFDCLDGMFAVSLRQLSFRFGTDFRFRCEQASLRFKNPGSLSILVEAGGVEIVFSRGNTVKFKTPKQIGLGLTIGTSLDFYGAFSSEDDERGRYFACAGKAKIGQFEAEVLIKIGMQRKENGRLAPSVVLYGQAPYEVPLFAGVVAKRFGAGVGINNRLVGFPENPDAEAILPVIETIDPARIEGWEFVERNGFYLAIVGTVLLASNTGAPDTVQAYVAHLILSIDLDLNVRAAGKMWLASSVQKVLEPENWRRPALVGAIAMSPKQRVISAALESKPNPFVEDNPTLSKILNNGHIKLSFLMSPRLVDFHLQDLSYRDNFLGIEMLFQGSLRLAVFDSAILFIMKFGITGEYKTPKLQGGGGGFEGEGSLNIDVELGGILSGRGLAAYGSLDVGIDLEVTAYIWIGFSITIDYGFDSETWSWEERFDLARDTIKLGLHGAFGFNERGDFGFEGSLSISVNICGYDLDIAPSFSINPEVIAEVRDRVRDFEARIEAAKQEILGRGTTAFALAPASGEEWLHVRSGEWNLLLPRADGKWFAESFAVDSTVPNKPRPLFDELVTKITLLDAGRNPLATIIPPWAEGLWTDDPIQRPRAQACLVETTRPATQPASTPPSFGEWQVSRDPRVESAGREYWTEVDAATRPDHSLPTRFKSPDEILASSRLPESVDTDFAELVTYLYWESRKLRLERHRSAEGKPDKRWRRMRGVLIQRFFQAFQSARTLELKRTEFPPEVYVWAPAGEVQGAWRGLGSSSTIGATSLRWKSSARPATERRTRSQPT
jgi:hypothetical protein